MNYSDFVLSICIVYALYYISMIATDYYKIRKDDKSNEAGENIDISDSLATYKPLKAKTIINQEENQDQSESQPKSYDIGDNDKSTNTLDPKKENETPQSSEHNAYTDERDTEENTQPTLPLNIHGGLTLVNMQEVISANSGENFFTDIIALS